MNRDETDGAVDIKAQIEKARRREILVPAVITAAAFGIGSVAAVWLGVVYPDALGRLSDSLITFFFIVTTAALLIGFALNAFFIVKIAELRRTLPLKLEAANGKVRETGPAVRDALNSLAEPLIGILANAGAAVRIFNHGRRREARTERSSSES